MMKNKLLRFALLYLFIYSFIYAGFITCKVLASTAQSTNIMQYYEQKGDVVMNFKKKSFLPILSKTTTSLGKIFLSKGILRLDLKDNVKTRFILTKQKLFHITCPSVLSSPMVEKWNLSSQQLAQTLIGALFNKQLFDARFRFASSKLKGRALVSRFTPLKKTDTIQVLLLKTENQLLLGATMIWNNGNKQDYEFFNIRLKQKIPDFFFKVKKLTCSKELDSVNALKKVSNSHKDKF